MADLEIALDNTLSNEGFYSNVAGDPGGETLWGIARNKQPYPEFWSIVDSLRSHADFPSCLKNNTHLLQLRHIFYDKHEWSIIRGDEIVDQSIANICFDMAVNKGIPIAIEFAQESAQVPMTGVMDDVTISALNDPTV